MGRVFLVGGDCGSGALGGSGRRVGGLRGCSGWCLETQTGMGVVVGNRVKGATAHKGSHCFEFPQREKSSGWVGEEVLGFKPCRSGRAEWGWGVDGGMERTAV